MFSFKNRGLDASVPKKSEALVVTYGRQPAVIPKYHPIYSKYKNLTFQGVIPSRGNLKEGLVIKRVFSIYNNSLPSTVVDSLRRFAGDNWFLAQPCKENVAKTLETWENAPTYSYHGSEFYNYALKFFEREYGHFFIDCIATDEEIAAFIDYTKSTGFPGNYFGFKNKGELFSDPNFKSFLINHMYLDEQAVWIAFPKIEYKNKEDLEQLKIRLFSIPPAHLLYEQLRFGRKVSERIKLQKWSAYGLNPYMGGANLLATRLLTKPIRLFYDISGWDKYINIIDEVLQIAFRCTNVPEPLKQNFAWMATNTTNFLIATTEGHVFRKPYGNPSGSGTTTRDNIFAHVIILATILSEAYYIKTGGLPSYQLLSSQVVQLFGDDSILAVDYEFDKVLDQQFLSDRFAQFGLKLKFLYGGVDYPITKMQFLGFTFTEKHGLYLPRYETDRLATSVLYNGPNANDRESYLARYLTIMIMSYPDPTLFQTLKEGWKPLCNQILASGILTNSEKAYCQFINLTENDIKNFFTGLESSLLSDSFFVTEWRRLEQKDD